MSIEALSLLDLARLGFGGILVAIGLLFMLGGAIGVLRFPDFYTRLHAASVSDAVGAVIVIAGLRYRQRTALWCCV
ncbi:MAG: monovalent cation/H(+) antiporter subunit G [Terricaulis sp.]